MRSLHTGIRASAGTGKTFQLTNRLLMLLFKGEEIEAILATTFTRKAAGEIVARLLQRLAEASQSQQGANELSGFINVPDLTTERSLGLLAEIAPRLHTLPIGTLDSVFGSVAARFAAELGLPPRWEMLDDWDDGDLRAEAIRRVLRGQPHEELLTLFRLLTKGETGRSVANQILNAVDQLHHIYLTTTPDHWRRLVAPPKISAEEFTETFEALKNSKRVEHATFEKGFKDAILRIDASDWLAFLENSVTQKIVDGDATYHNKPIPPEFRELYRKIIDHACAYVIDDIAEATWAAYQLLDHFNTEYAALKAIDGRLRFEDVTLALAKALSNTSSEVANDIAYYLGTTTRHLLIDEFQDTSIAQWQVLLPLAKEITSHSEDHSFLCVGDVKQAIYGWRGGSAEILFGLKSDLPSIEFEDLSKSFRSAPPVIDFVNNVFSHLSGSPRAGKKNSALSEALNEWAASYVRHETEKTKETGCVLCITADAPEDGQSNKDTTYSTTARLVHRLVKANRAKSIAVLLRKNTGVARMKQELAGLGVSASQEGGNPLTDATSVEIVLALLRWADRHDDMPARYFVANTPLGKTLGISPLGDDPKQAEVTRKIRRQLIEDGYGHTIAGWAEVLDPHLGEHEAFRLRQLVSLAFDYDARATLRPSDFADFVEQRTVEDPSEASVRVMTVHQAKGLEFDAVFLPELDDKLVGQTPAFVAWSDHPGGPTTGVLRYVNQSLQKYLPKEFQSAFRRQSITTIRESICILYVAITRAANAVIVVNAPSATNEGSLPQTFAGVLRASLTDGAPLAANHIWYSSDDNDWLSVLTSDQPA